MAMRRRRPAMAAFLDKDGTLVENVPYNVDPELVTLTRGAGPGLRRLADAGYSIVVVTNQSGVARGLFPAHALRTVRRRIEELLEPWGVELAGFYACPHHPDGLVARYAVHCSCRKPHPGLLFDAAAALGIDLGRSWMVGDILDDVEAGCRAGCRTALIGNGGETLWRAGTCREPDVRASNLDEAARAILDPTGRPREVPWVATSSN